MNRAFCLVALGALVLGCDLVSTLPAKPGQFVVVYPDEPTHVAVDPTPVGIPTARAGAAPARPR